MNYKVLSFEQKQTSTGKLKADANLQDLTGQMFNKVTIWEDSPVFPTLAIGGSIEGNVSVKQNGKYTNSTFYADKAWNATPSASTPLKSTYSPNKGAGIAQAQVVKATNIAHAQERREDGIMISGTARDATLIMVALFQKGEIDLENWKEEWRSIRYWLVKNYHNTHETKVSGTELVYPPNDFDIPFGDDE